MVEVQVGRAWATDQKYKAWSGGRTDYRKKSRFIKPAPSKNGESGYSSVSSLTVPINCERSNELQQKMAIWSCKADFTFYNSLRLTQTTCRQANNLNIAVRLLAQCLIAKTAAPLPSPTFLPPLPGPSAGKWPEASCRCFCGPRITKAYVISYSISYNYTRLYSFVWTTNNFNLREH